MNWEKHFLILANKASIWGEVLYSIPKTNKKAKGEKPTMFWTIPHFTPARSSTWQLITQIWVINGWASKGNQIIHVWELDPIKCLDSPATFTLIYSIGHVFVVSELFILWARVLPLKVLIPFMLMSLYHLCCFSLREHTHTVSMCARAAVFWHSLQLFALLYAVTEARSWKIGPTCYPMLIFLFIDSKCTNPLPKQCNKDYKWGSRDNIMHKA